LIPQLKNQSLQQFIVCVYGLVLPISIAATNILLPIVIATALWHYKDIVTSFQRRKLFYLLGFVLLSYIVASSLMFTLNPRMALAELNHFRELVLVLIISSMLIQTGHARLAIKAFVVGATILALAQWGTVFSAKLASSLEAKRITNGFLLACAAYSAAWLVITHPKAEPGSNLRKVWALCAFVIALSCLFAVRGRTGHLIIIVLSVLFVWQFVPKAWRKVLTVLSLATVVGIAALSPIIKQRFNEQVNELHTYSSQQNIATSSGLRIEFALNTWEMIQQHPLFGIGYGNFEVQYKQYARNKYLSDTKSAKYADEPSMYQAHPHNEYLYHGVSGGLLAMLLVIAWLAYPVVASFRHRTPASMGSTAFAIAMALGCMFNAFLLNLPEGHAYIFLLAAMLSLADEKRSTEQS
jgi:O-antigen ligase